MWDPRKSLLKRTSRAMASIGLLGGGRGGNMDVGSSDHGTVMVCEGTPSCADALAAYSSIDDESSWRSWLMWRETNDFGRRLYFPWSVRIDCRRYKRQIESGPPEFATAGNDK